MSKACVASFNPASIFADASVSLAMLHFVLRCSILCWAREAATRTEMPKFCQIVMGPAGTGKVRRLGCAHSLLTPRAHQRQCMCAVHLLQDHPGARREREAQSGNVLSVHSVAACACAKSLTMRSSLCAACRKSRPSCRGHQIRGSLRYVVSACDVYVHGCAGALMPDCVRRASRHSGADHADGRDGGAGLRAERRTRVLHGVRRALNARRAARGSN